MKKFYILFFCGLLCAANSAYADFPQAPVVDGKITIFAKFEIPPCDDVVLAGSHNNWRPNPEELPKFVPAGVINGKDWSAEGWWKVQISFIGGILFDTKI